MPRETAHLQDSSRPGNLDSTTNNLLSEIETASSAPAEQTKSSAAKATTLSERVSPASPGGLSVTKLRDLPVGLGSAQELPGLSVTKLSDLPVGQQAFASTPSGSMWDTARQRDLAERVRPGAVLAERYEVRREVGRGGMGLVVAAWDRVRQEEVAIKVLQPHVLADPQARERFLNEAKLTGSLSHAGIVRVYDLNESGPLTFLTMELLKGSSLRDEIVRRKEQDARFTLAEVQRIGVQLCAALQFAHAQGVIHRDVKPENIWLQEDGSVKVMDFGIARLMTPSQFATTGLAMGTAYYMAPEQMKGQKDIDARADQYSLGVVMYELLTGEIPQGAIGRPHEVVPEIPVGLSNAVMTALAGSPAKRFESLQQLQTALEKAVLVRQRPLVKVAVAAVVLGLLLLGLFQARQPLLRWSKQALAGETVAQAIARRDVAQRAAEGFPKSREGLPSALKIATAEEADKQLQAGLTSLEAQEYAVAATSFDAAAAAYEQAQAEAKQLRGVFDSVNAKLTELRTLQTAWGELCQSLPALPKPDALAVADKSQQEVVAQLESGEVATAQRTVESAVQQLKDARAAWQRDLATKASIAKTQADRSLRDAEKILTELRTQVREAEIRLDKLPAKSPANEIQAAKNAVATRKQIADEFEQRLKSEGYFDRATSAMTTGDSLLRDEPWRALEQFALVAVEVAAVSKVRSDLEQAALAKTEESRAAARLVVESAQSLLKAREFATALTKIDEAIALDAGSSTAFVLRSKIQFRLYKYAESLADAEESVRLDPKSASALAQRSWMRSYGADASGALVDANAALMIDKSNVDALVARASARNKAGDNDGALVDVRQALQKDPENLDGLDILASVLSSQKKYMEALATTDRGLKLDPTYGEFFQTRANIRSAQLEWTKAVEEYTRYLAFAPQRSSAYTARGGALTWLKLYDRALADYDKALQLDPNDALAYVVRGNIFLNLLDYDRALTAYNKTIELNPNYTDAYIGRAVVWAYRKDLERAIQDCTRAIELVPNNPLAFSRRGLYFSAKKEFDRALADHNQAIALAPADSYLFANRGSCYLDRKDFDSAVTDYSKSIQLNGQDSYAWSGRGTAYWRLKQDYQAIQDCTTAIQLDPKNSGAYKVRGHAHALNNDHYEAIADYTEMLRLSPDADTYNSRAIEYGKLKQYDNAIEDYKEAMRLEPSNDLYRRNLEIERENKENAS